MKPYHASSIAALLLLAAASARAEAQAASPQNCEQVKAAMADQEARLQVGSAQVNKMATDEMQAQATDRAAAAAADKARDIANAAAPMGLAPGNAIEAAADAAIRARQAVRQAETQAQVAATSTDFQATAQEIARLGELAASLCAGTRP